MNRIPRTSCAAFAVGTLSILVGCERVPTAPEKTPGPSYSIVAGSGDWTIKAPMPTPRLGVTSGVLAGRLYVISGIGPTRGDASNAVEAYDPASDTWSTRAPTPVGVTYGGAGTVNNKLYVVGGCGFDADCRIHVTNSLLIYDPTINAWSTGAAMPTARFYPAVGVIGGKLYVTGGAGPSGNLTSLEIYDPGTDSWSSGAPLPVATGGAGAVLNGKLYVVGGARPGVLLATVQVYDPTTNTWANAAPMQVPRDGLGAAGLNGIIYAIGGADQLVPGVDVTTRVEAYDVATDSWTVLASMPTGKSSPQPQAIHGVIYVAGSAPGNDPSAVLEALTPAPTTLVPQVFDAVADFSTTTNTASSTWSYRNQSGRSRDGNYPLLPSYGPDLAETFTPLDPKAWRTGATPSIGVNRTGSDATLVGTSLVIPNGVMFAHPGPDDLVVLSWLAPSAAVVSIRFSFADLHRGCGDGITWYVERNSAATTLASGFFGDGDPTGSGPQTLSDIVVAAGERINFIVDPIRDPVFGDYGCDTTQLTATIEASTSGGSGGPQPPVANAGGSYNGSEGSPIAFDGTRSSDPAGSALTYSWDFGDGSPPATSATPSHTYTMAGVYTAALTVSNGSLTGTAASAVTVFNLPPSITLGPLPTSMALQSLTLTASFHDGGAGDGPWAYSISWGDGSTPQSGTAADQSMRLTGTHTYALSGTYSVVFQVVDKFGASASGNATLGVGLAGQTITFPALPAHTFGDAPFTVSATASSGEAVTFTASGTCTISTMTPGGPGTVSLTGADSCTITAHQAGDGGTYGPAPDVARTFSIAPASATIALDASSLSPVYNGAPRTVTFTTTPTGLAGVTLSYDGSAQAPVNAGSYSVAAHLTNPNYTAPDATGTLVIQRANQSISFAPLAGKTYGDAAFGVSASASSGLTVVFTAAGNCTISGNIVSLTGAGGCTITADQVGDRNFNPAASVPQSVSIAKATPVITWNPPASMVYGSALGATQLNATASGVGGAGPGGTFNYSPPSGTILNPGTQTLGVTFTPDDQVNYTGATRNVSIAVVYNTAVGHVDLQPINPPSQPISVFKIGSTITVKFQLFLADGVTPAATAGATIQVNKLSDGAPSAVNESVVSVVPNQGVNFRYDATSQQYLFNLGTKGWTVGTYRITALLDDRSSIVADVGVR